MSETTASVRELRDGLADYIDRAAHDEVTIVTRRGKEVAAVVPVQVVKEWRQWEEERFAALIDERMAASDGTGATLDEVMAETLARPE
jgi:prevent-host-death family protein